MSKQELLSAIKPRYLKADKEEKGRILDEFCKSTSYVRKYAIQILQADYDYFKVKNEGRKPRKEKYDSSCLLPIIKVWELLDFPCGIRLKPVLLSTIESLTLCKEMTISSEALELIEQISAKTLDRRLTSEREIRKLKKNRGTTRHGTLLKSSIPIRITNWDTSKVGFMEMDTVAHNGGNPAGEFIYSLDMVEIYSGWSEQFAVMGKGQAGVIQAVNTIVDDLPFKTLGLDSDGGSEFINWHMIKYCEERNLFFTRSRPERSNDNAYVEQKNYTHIRQIFGYGRFDTIEQLKGLNNLYRKELRLYNNFFKPVMKIKTKEKINNSVCKKTYDQAKTPYQRLMECDQISQEQKEKLKALYLSLNLVELKKIINEKIKNIKQL